VRASDQSNQTVLNFQYESAVLHVGKTQSTVLKQYHANNGFKMKDKQKIPYWLLWKRKQQLA
jgi:hypothetical protein